MSIQRELKPPSLSDYALPCCHMILNNNQKETALWRYGPLIIRSAVWFKTPSVRKTGRERSGKMIELRIQLGSIKLENLELVRKG
jgi:hypothetical protein